MSSWKSLQARSAVITEEDTLVQLGISTGLFSAEEADLLLRSSLQGIFTGSSDPASHAARVVDGSDGKPVGWTYLAVDSAGASGVWELLWIGVSPSAQRSGVGSVLLKDAEDIVSKSGGRMLIICTSSTDVTAGARSFYLRNGYVEVGRIPDYYGSGDAKVIYWKTMTQHSSLKELKSNTKD